MLQSEPIRSIPVIGLVMLLGLAVSVQAGQVTAPCGVASTSVTTGGTGGTGGTNLFSGTSPAAAAGENPLWLADPARRGQADTSDDLYSDDADPRSDADRMRTGHVEVSLHDRLVFTPNPR